MLALLAAATGRAEPWHAEVSAGGWMLEERTPPTDAIALMAAPLASSAPRGVPRDAIAAATSPAGGLHADAAAVFMDWPLIAGVRLSGLPVLPRRTELREAALPRPFLLGDAGAPSVERFSARAPAGLNPLAFSDAADAGSAVLLVDTAERLGAARGSAGLAGVPLAALEAQLAQMRAGIARSRPAPQASLGVRFRF
jgi:hypothetical protein